MLQNAYFLAKIGADTAENEQQFAEICLKLATEKSGAPPPQENAADALEQKVDSWTVESLTAEKESDRAPSRDPGLTKLAKLTSKVGCFSPHICVGKSEEEIRKVRHFG